MALTSECDGQLTKPKKPSGNQITTNYQPPPLQKTPKSIKETGNNKMTAPPPRKPTKTRENKKTKTIVWRLREGGYFVFVSFLYVFGVLGQETKNSFRKQQKTKN